eukprot:15476055-Alexandrium_andersonii.AAC.1
MQAVHALWLQHPEMKAVDAREGRRSPREGCHILVVRALGAHPSRVWLKVAEGWVPPLPGPAQMAAH